MDNFNKKKRAINFSQEEVKVLLDTIEKYSNIINGPLAPGNTQARKNAAWLKVLDAVNSVSERNRSVNEIKRKFKDVKFNSKRKVVEKRRSQFQTGGGPCDGIQLSPAEEIAARFLRKTSIEGISAGIELGGSQIVVSSATTSVEPIPTSPSTSSSISPEFNEIPAPISPSVMFMSTQLHSSDIGTQTENESTSEKLLKNSEAQLRILREICSHQNSIAKSLEIIAHKLNN